MPRSIQLLRSQTNAVFRAIVESGLQPADFFWNEEDSRILGDTTIPRLTHSPTRFAFWFDMNGDKGRACFASPHNGIADPGFMGNATGWLGVLLSVNRWLEAIKLEHLEPDLWRINSSERALIAPSLDELGNERFEPSEIARIAAGIEQLRTLLTSTGNYTAEQLQFIASRLNHLESASHQLGRKDWITLAMGTLTNIIVGVALAPEAARELIRTAGNLLGWITTGIHLLQ